MRRQVKREAREDKRLARRGGRRRDYRSRDN